MLLVLLATLGVAWWTWRRNGKRFSPNFWLATASGLAGVWQLAHADIPIGLGLMLVALILFASNKPLSLRRRKTVPPAPATLPSMRIDEARAVLGLPDNADAAAIRAAHRRLVTKVHPDQGGSADLAARVNLARDILLAEQEPARRR
jgi:DnaJ family protein C protein 19